jgi:hypothetical protein
VQDGVFQERRKEGDIEKRAQALRDFFAELLLNNEASEAANLRLHPGLLTQGVSGVPWEPFAPPSGPRAPSQDPV